MDLVRGDPGHGGSDPGAVGNGLEEKNVALFITQLMVSGLRSNDINVELTRVRDATLDQYYRAGVLRRPALCSVSIHCNAVSDPTVRGHEVFVSAFGIESQELGLAISKSLTQRVSAIPPRNPAVKTKLLDDGSADWYYFIREPQSVGIPGVLVEVGFVSNADDAAYLGTFWGQFSLAHAICRGIMEWAGYGQDKLHQELSECTLDLIDAQNRLAQIETLAKGAKPIGATD